MDLNGEAMILSETYVYWRRPKSLWGRTWANISHCYCQGDNIGIILYGGEAEAVIIPCGNRLCAIRVYTALAHNSDRMGNPSNIIPVDLITRENENQKSRNNSNFSNQNIESSNENNETVNENFNQNNDNFNGNFNENFKIRQKRAMALAGEIDGYRFGTANKTILRKIIGPESDVLKRIEGRIENGYSTWEELDESTWKLVWEWDCTHTGDNTIFTLNISFSCN